ncbi:eukaryotic translation initiation factor 4E class II [Crepidotus variabilis]|uniref:Eukaryotic translation initiation factor 4E class II n=1 Tax=Crepidotus variabilis TaxID=179855 RepID=A0A9P6EKZ7_9AGAR|nr:eukaryotic translation initiation factor 4E class II [Crepidotus variabilis]
MSNYFSNHSASRFLANSSNGSVNPPAAPPVLPQGNGAGGTAAQVPRRIPSKHFSTTVATSQADVTATSTPSSVTSVHVHPLRNTWVFWFRQQRTPGNKIISYEEGIKKISAFSSVESFWSLWTHLAPPSSLQPTTDYLLFHSGIRRPIWEDPLNITGGKWIIRLKKGIADRFWEDLVMAIVGDQFDECHSPYKSAVSGEEGEDNSMEWPEICGCTISVRQNEDIVSLWNRVDGDVKLREQIRDTLRKVLNLPSSTVMEYKSNNDSMQDKSSFRRTNVDRVPVSAHQ